MKKKPIPFGENILQADRLAELLGISREEAINMIYDGYDNINVDADLERIMTDEKMKQLLERIRKSKT